MEGEFIKPNWHVLLVHYPIALVTVGFLAEVIGAVSRRPGLRYSARWMVAIGALLGIPTAVLGLYAWREEVVAGAPIDLGNTWGQVVAASAWEPRVFEGVEWHAWLNAAALVLLLFVAVSWIAASPERRSATSFGRTAVTFIAVALLSASAWFGGELVYHHGTGVMTEVGVTAGTVGQPEWLRGNFPPLQVHLLGGGFLAALLLLALAQSLRFWREARDLRAAELALGVPGTHTGHGTVHTTTHTPGVAHEDLFAAEPEVVGDAAPVRRPSAAAVRGLWGAGLIGGAAVAAGGLWSMLGSLSTDRLQRFWDSLGDDPRVFAHLVVGACLILLPLLPLAMPRFLGRSRFVAGSMVLGFSVLLAAQVGVGTLMLFDGHAGPLISLADAPMESPVAPDPVPGEFTDPETRGRPIEAGGPRDPARDGE